MVTVYGTICLDRLRRIDAYPPPGGFAFIEEERLLPGGEALNTAIALARWGVSTKLRGNAVGSDELSLLLTAAAGEPQLDARLPTVPAPAPVCDIYVTPDGVRTMFGKGFAELVDLGTLEDALEPGNWFTADPNHDDHAVDAVRRAIASGMRIYLQDFLSPELSLPAGSISQTSIEWTGASDRVEAEAWLRAHAARFGAFTIVTRGGEGLLAGDTNGATHFPAFEVSRVLDSTGAGDVFRAGVLYGLHAAWPLGHALRFGAAAGALSSRGLGATSALPSEREVQALIDGQPTIATFYDAELPFESNLG